jgi:hypothetical protein
MIHDLTIATTSTARSNDPIRETASCNQVLRDQKTGSVFTSERLTR